MNAIATRKLRFDIDALSKGVVLIDFPLNGHLLEAQSKLLYAKAWLGKSFRYLSKPTVEEIAKECHEANRHYCESIGDNSQVEWDKAEDWQKESAINGVRFYNSDITPEQQHEAWMKDKKEAGWKYGKEKDAKKKTHPCMVPYDKLPEDQKLKDEIFQSVIKQMTDFSSPYKNDGKRKLPEDIEPTAEAASDFTFPGHLENAIQKADFMRQEIQKQIVIAEEGLLDAITTFEFLDDNNTRFNDSMYKACMEQSYIYLCEARFELGFYLESIRNNNDDGWD